MTPSPLDSGTKLPLRIGLPFLGVLCGCTGTHGGPLGDPEVPNGGLSLHLGSCAYIFRSVRRGGSICTVPLYCEYYPGYSHICPRIEFWQRSHADPLCVSSSLPYPCATSEHATYWRLRSPPGRPITRRLSLQGFHPTRFSPSQTRPVLLSTV